MKRLVPLQTAAIFFLILMTACTLPQPEPDPAVVATAVAATLAPQPVLTSTSDEAVLLPHAVFFISERSGSPQVWRLDRDGVTQTQVTNETAGVLSFSVSRADGSVAFVSSNQLYLVENDGGNRRLVVDNAAADMQSADFAYRQRISDPKFSPDGHYLAYGYNGLWVLDLTNNQAVHLLENDLSDEGAPDRIYASLAWAPNSQQLLLSIASENTSTLGFMNPGAHALFTEVDARNICCHVNWAQDSSSVLIASPHTGLIRAGMWRYDALTGDESELIAGETDGLYEFAGWPLQLEDGSLRYLYGSATELPGVDLPLYIVSSDANGVSNRQQLRAESFSNVGELLWADDGSLALVLQYRPEGGPAGPVVLEFMGEGQTELLLDSAQQLQWGN